MDNVQFTLRYDTSGDHLKMTYQTKDEKHLVLKFLPYYLMVSKATCATVCDPHGKHTTFS